VVSSGEVPDNRYAVSGMTLFLLFSFVRFVRFVVKSLLPHAREEA
jgi:hypothetical protein